MAKTVMLANGNVGPAAGLRKIIEDALGIPKGRWFEVRFAMDEIVTVTCEYYPMFEEVAAEKPEEV